MKRLDLYENIPETSSLIRINLYDELCKPIFQIHWHGHLEIHYIIEGTAVERCENDVIRVNAGECVVINSNELHEGLDGNCRYLCILVPQHFAKNSNIILNRVVKDEEIGSMAKCIIEEYKGNKKADDIAIAGYAALILAKLYRSYVFREIKEENYKAYSERILLLNEVIKYIHENYLEDIELRNITEKFNINMYYFCHIFKEFTGVTFKNYLNKVRVDKAEELLMNTDVAISEVAYMCGFNDSNYFSRKFRQIKGKTPREARKTDTDGKSV
ncbi:MAG: AraC family transcriptional regulator [Ruminococcaceae bacterium]|nr:AraC family transcriptional regulator [Oscillospiraceae bacterium]